MKPENLKILKVKFYQILLISLLAAALFGQDIRPIRDDVGYCWEKKQISGLISFLASQYHEKDDCPGLIAGISPHDDYLYAGKVYYPLFKNIQSREILILGVTHGGVRKEIGDPKHKLILERHRFWKGPYGKVAISPLRDFLIEKMNPEYIIVDNRAHQLEHSIESAIPFLQYYNHGIAITPIMVTAMPFEKMREISKDLSRHILSYIKGNQLKLGRDIFILISADANHYGEDFNHRVFGLDARAHRLATALDRRIVNTCLRGPISLNKIKKLSKWLWGNSYLESGNTLWCGKYSLPFGLLTLTEITRGVESTKSLTGHPFIYSDTYSSGVLPLKKTGMGITAPFSLRHWVGFFSAGFSLE